MKTIRKANLFETIPVELSEEWFETLLSDRQIKIERIVSKGHCSAPNHWYDQHWDEWVLLLKGQAGIKFDGRDDPLEMHPGDHILIPAHTRHRVAWTADDQETVWLAVHIHSHDDHRSGRQPV